MVVTDILWMAILFLLPGMASFTVYRYVAGYAIDKLYKFIFYSAIWAILDYGLVEIIARLIYGIPFGKYLNVWIMFKYKFADVSVDSILSALITGIVAAYVIGRLMRYVRLNYPGLLRVKLWDYYMNFLWKEKQRVIVYDYKNKYKYVGYIKNFSYFSPQKEIVLQNPEMYSMQENQGESLIKGKNREIYIQLEDTCFSIVNLNETPKNKKGSKKRVFQRISG